MNTSIISSLYHLPSSTFLWTGRCKHALKTYSPHLDRTFGAQPFFFCRFCCKYAVNTSITSSSYHLPSSTFFYTQAILHTIAFTHRRFYTPICTQRLLHTDAFTRSFAHRRFYTQTLLHTDAFTHSFAHRRFYTQTLLDTDAFTHRRFYTRTLLHADAFTHRRFYTQNTRTHTHTHSQNIAI